MISNPIKQVRKMNVRKYCWAHLRSSKPRNSAPISILNRKRNRSIIIHEDKQNQSEDDINFKVDQPKLAKIIRKIIYLYESNLQFYKCNETKLINAITIQLKQKNYLYKKCIMEIIKSNGSTQLSKQIDFQKLQQELQLLKQFLTNLYQRKKIKEIQIISENISEQEKIIGNKTNVVEYQNIYRLLNAQNGGKSNKNFDFIAQYQNICMKFGSQETNTKPHMAIRHHLNLSNEKIKNIFQSNCKQKQRRRFLIKSNRKP